ncbi:MAG: sulfatase-like hydrolase/transferase [Pirellulales bacterium]|nr:sulfatase-like hydrolase/transferase [Pirellulales bacterium]
MTRLHRVVLSIGFVLGLTVFTMAAESEKASPKGKAASRPNFVFVFADDWGWGDLGCYGHSTIRTPNLDRLARQGTLFTQFYVASGVCSPSRTAIMTGHFPARHAIHGHLSTPALNKKRAMPNALDADVTTVTDLLKQAGYVTGHFGKWHLGPNQGSPAPSEYGIDEFKGVRDFHESYSLWGKELRAQSTPMIIDETIKFIEKHRDEPFYVQAWLLDMHATLMPSEEQQKAYPRHKGALKIYYSAATDADKQIGRLMAKLDDLGLAENTVFVFSSDNGPEDIVISNASHSGVGSAGPFRGRKRSLYEGGVRMPFIVRWPAITPKGNVDDKSVIGGVDWLPTICRLAGVELPGGLNLDGEDMSAAIRGTSTTRSKPLMWEWRFKIFGHILHRSPMLSIRDGKWKLLMNPDRSRVELYDIPADPSEMNNLAAENVEVVERLAKTVLAWQKTLPPGPVEPVAGKNDYPWPQPAK